MNIHQVKAVLMEGALRFKQSRYLMQCGSFHIVVLDKDNNPMNKKLAQSALVILYTRHVSIKSDCSLSEIPRLRCVVAAINPETNKWINGKPNLRLMYGLLKKDQDRRGSVLKNMWDFARAVYHLLFIQGEYRYRDMD